jgi:hypothetical protein
MADDIDLADLIADLRLRLEWGMKLMPEQVEYLLGGGSLPACEEPSFGSKSPGPKPDPDLPFLHEAIAMLFALYRASGMNPKTAMDKVMAHCRYKRSMVYTMVDKHPIKLGDIAPSLLPGLIEMFESVTDAAAPNTTLASVWLMVVEKIIKTRAVSWDGLLAILERENAEEPPL